MPSSADSELLTRTGAGTAMGEYFRRFWHPIALSSDLAEPDSPPIRVQVMLSHGRFAASLLAAIATTAMAQPAPHPARVGVLLTSPGPFESVRDALTQLGYVEGKTIAFETRERGGQPQELSKWAKELVEERVDLIIAIGNAASEAALKSTSDIPIVFQQGDPVGAGLAKSLGRPGGNATGVYVPTPELEAKRVELLKQVLPNARRIGYLRNTSNPLAPRSTDEVERAAQADRLHVVRIDVASADGLEHALDAMSRQKLDAILVSSDPVLSTHAKLICTAARRARLPLSAPWEHYHRYGALLSYGPSRTAIAQATALYVDRVLKGTPPHQLPVEELSSFELRLDMREAAALKVQIPQTVLMRADQVMR
jgi:putative ABC transport system substrate-binding protein